MSIQTPHLIPEGIKAPLLLFTDGSVHPPTNMGYGAFLATTDLTAAPDIQLKPFEHMTSSQLELETLIWALQLLKPQSVIIYTDSQTIIGLPTRRAGLEEKNYRTRPNKLMKHADLYRTFFRLTDQIHCTFVKIKGHQPTHQKTKIDRLFSLVDRAARQALRDDLRGR